MLVAWVYNTLDTSIRSTVSLPDNVKTMWDDLHDRFSLGNGPRIHEIKNQIVDCKQCGRPLVDYYSDLKQLWDELASYVKTPNCSCSASAEYVKIYETEKLHRFLIGLDARKYSAVVSGLLMMDPLPSLNYAYAKVATDERHHTVVEAHEARPDNVGFAASGSAGGRLVASGKTTTGDEL
ncbi:uncharacterized protein [Euphorbia lathyris]|uniref:uncharacterized protein n=1 Tax=Euphorbia lathyris TaxID=212925 RepID=UPI0033132248